MRYIWQHITTIIETYDGSLPLAHFLKSYFKQYPILGSRDRKTLSAMAYSWYRCCKGFGVLELGIGIEDRIRLCMTMCGNEKLLPPTISGAIIPDITFDINTLFPFDVVLSAGITKEDWLMSMLIQPNLFLRIRKDMGKVTSLLNGANIPFTFITDNCLQLPNGAKIDTVLPEDTYAVQDASSQQTGTFFHPKKKEQWYDCCAGAGGKSLLLSDMEPGVRLTVSDARESIIHNLKQRFKLYRLEPPVAHVTDVSNPASLGKALGAKQFDNIICDAPCSGSGTWGRTPEQLYFFDPETIEKFSTLQKAIAINVSRHLKEGGRLIYITCSVFQQENEEVVYKIIQKTGLKLIDSTLINGTNICADSMFVAQFKKAQPL
jgi:16S rRNA (cytosine967-C5)-methyltransferase